MLPRVFNALALEMVARRAKSFMIGLFGKELRVVDGNDDEQKP